MMADKRSERIVSALNNITSDGLSLPGEEDKVAALFEEYLCDSADNSGSDESDNESVGSHIIQFSTDITWFAISSVDFVG